MNTKKKIKAAKVSLMKDSPFFSYLVVKLSAEEEEKVKTMGVNIKGELLYNKEFVNSLSKEHLKGVLCHEVLHLGLEHELRRGNRNQRAWNVACDYAVNAIVRNNGFKLPEKALYDENYVGKPSETIYDDIRDKVDKNSKNKSRGGDDSESEESGNSSGGESNSEDIPPELQDREGKVSVGNDEGDQFDHHPSGASESDLSEDEVKEKSQNWKDEMAAAAQQAKSRGNMPAGMDRVIDELFADKLNWKQMLRKYITREIPINYSYSRPRKMYYSNKIYLPQVKRKGINIVVAVDTSGSIRTQELKKFASEINGILESHEGVSMDLLIGDAKLQEHKEIDNSKYWYKNVNFKGGGGTSHKWVFDWIEKNSPKARILVAFTDGYTEFPESADINTLWISTGADPKEYPFGKAVRFDLD